MHPHTDTHPRVICEGRTYPSVACFGAIPRSDRQATLDAIDRKRSLVATIARNYHANRDVEKARN